MVKKSLTLFFAVAFFALSGFAQGIFCENRNDTINRLDSAGLKQGLWVFFANGTERMTCMYVNDTIVGNRTYIVDSSTKLVRHPIVDTRENFEILKNGVVEKGFFDYSNGEILSEKTNGTSSLDSTIQFIMGIPPLYAFGTKNISVEIERLVEPLRSKIKKNKVLIEIMIDKSGRQHQVSISMLKKNAKLELVIRAALTSLDRWQPAFNTWNTQPYKKQIVLTF